MNQRWRQNLKVNTLRSCFGLHQACFEASGRERARVHSADLVHCALVSIVFGGVQRMILRAVSPTQWSKLMSICTSLWARHSYKFEKFFGVWKFAIICNIRKPNSQTESSTQSLLPPGRHGLCFRSRKKCFSFLRKKRNLKPRKRTYKRLDLLSHTLTDLSRQ